MKAYNCDKLLFTCWSMTSMTVFLARFDSELWNVCWSELVKVYGSEHPKRPTRFSEVSNRLRPLVKDYVEKNVEFLGEFPSCQAQSEESKDVADVHTDYPYVKPEATDRTIQTYMISDLQDCLVSAKKWVESAYYYSRTVATEILVYMLNYENFFSTFRDMDPTGQGTPKPDAIPDMMSSAAELDLIRLDHDR